MKEIHNTLNEANNANEEIREQNNVASKSKEKEAAAEANVTAKVKKTQAKSKKRMVDPVTGKPSDAKDAISVRTYKSRQKVDPKTGKPSNAEDAISYGVYRNRLKVDPKTGKRSDAHDAISYSTFKTRCKVDPVTGKPSDAEDAISYAAYKQRQKVDPVTGKRSDAANAISYSSYKQRKKVDPVIGKPSDAPDAIHYANYKQRQKVDPVTGKPSNAPDAISLRIYKSRQKVDAVTGKPSDADNAIPQYVYYNRKRTQSKRKKVSPTASDVPNDNNLFAETTILAEPSIQNNIVKAEPTEFEIDSNTLKDAVRAKIKAARDGNNASSNCAKLVEYSLALLEAALTDKTLPEEKVSTASSVKETPITVFYEIKQEDGKAFAQTDSISSLRMDKGLHALLPLDTTPMLDVTTETTSERPYKINLESNTSQSERVEVSKLNEVLKERAHITNNVLIGRVNIAPQPVVGKNNLVAPVIAHSVAFCATSDEVFYMDGQLYDGIKKEGDPIFNDLAAVFQFQGSENENNEEAPIYENRAFFAIHNLIPAKISNASDVIEMEIEADTTESETEEEIESYSRKRKSESQEDESVTKKAKLSPSIFPLDSNIVQYPISARPPTTTPKTIDVNLNPVVNLPPRMTSTPYTHFIDRRSSMPYTSFFSRSEGIQQGVAKEVTRKTNQLPPPNTNTLSLFDLLKSIHTTTKPSGQLKPSNNNPLKKTGAQ